MPKSKKAENAQNQRAEKWRGPKTLKMGKIKKAEKCRKAKRLKMPKIKGLKNGGDQKR